MKMSIDQTGAKNVSREDWIKFRAEQLAVRADPITFASLYAKRATHFGTKRFRSLHLEFCTFLQPFVDDASRAWSAECHAAGFYQERANRWTNTDARLVSKPKPATTERPVMCDVATDGAKTCPSCLADLDEENE